MSSVQKLAAAVLAGLVLSLVVVVGGVAYVRAGGGTKLTLAQAPTATSTIPTLDDQPPPQEKDLVEETTTTSSTTTTTVPGFQPDSTTSSPPTTRFAVPVSGSGAVLQPPGAPSTRQLSSGSGCQGLADTNASEVHCEQFRARGGDLVWLTQTTREGVLGSGQGRSYYVFQRSGASQWTTVLEKLDLSGSQFKSVNVRLADVSGDGAVDAVFGFRSAASGLLAVDVVEGPGTVTAHRDASNGSARVSTGQVDIWYASGASFVHEVIRSVDGSYRVVSSEQISSGEVPPSQL